MLKWMKECSTTFSIVFMGAVRERWLRRRLVHLALHPRFALRRIRGGRALGRGVRFFHDKKYEEALGKFEDAQGISGRSGDHLYFMYEMMATCHHKLGNKEGSKEFAALARESKHAYDQMHARRLRY